MDVFNFFIFHAKKTTMYFDTIDASEIPLTTTVWDGAKTRRK